jgi:hypothetical protein
MRFSMKKAKRLPKKLVHEVRSIALTEVSFRRSFGDSNERQVPYSGGGVIGQGAWQYIERYPEMELEPQDQMLVESRKSKVESREVISKMLRTWSRWSLGSVLNPHKEFSNLDFRFSIGGIRTTPSSFAGSPFRSSPGLDCCTVRFPEVVDLAPR